MAATGCVALCEEFFASKAFQCEKDKSFPEFAFTADLYAFARGRSLGFLFPYEDHFFFQILNAAGSNSPENISKLHDGARKYVNARFRLPRAMRYKVPNIVTVAISETSFPPESIRLALKKTPDIVGGERHSIFLLDLLQKKIISQGTEAQYVEGFPVQFNKVSPINRAYHLIHSAAKKFDATLR